MVTRKLAVYLALLLVVCGIDLIRTGIAYEIAKDDGGAPDAEANRFNRRFVGSAPCARSKSEY